MKSYPKRGKQSGWHLTHTKAQQRISLGRRLLDAKRRGGPPSQPMRRLKTANVTPLLVPLVELAPNGCRYPYGDSGAYRFCGRPRLAGFSYCEAHARLCFKPG
jgi:hypothetical protein